MLSLACVRIPQARVHICQCRGKWVEPLIAFNGWHLCVTSLWWLGVFLCHPPHPPMAFCVSLCFFLIDWCTSLLESGAHSLAWLAGQRTPEMRSPAPPCVFPTLSAGLTSVDCHCGCWGPRLWFSCLQSTTLPLATSLAPSYFSKSNFFDSHCEWGVCFKVTGRFSTGLS